MIKPQGIQWRAALRQALMTYFDESDLRELCFDLGLDFEALSGSNKTEKVIDLIEDAIRLGKITELIDYCSRTRPTVDWNAIRSAAIQDAAIRSVSGPLAGDGQMVGQLTSLLTNRIFQALMALVVVALIVIFITRGNGQEEEATPVADAPIDAATATATLAPTAEPSPTSTPAPTDTLAPTGTPGPTNTSTPSPTPTHEPSSTPEPGPMEPAQPTAEMIRVPAGEFGMGSSYTTAADFDPRHVVFISEFYIDKYEVTNAQYMACVEAGVCTAPLLEGSSTRENYFDDPAQFGNFPVIYVTWNDADTYCTWRGARLPTEAEWEKAAGWNPNLDVSTIFPWGDDDPILAWANYQGDDTLAVGALTAGRSHLGGFDMAGNVLEWVADHYDPDYYSVSPPRDPKGPAQPTGSRVAKGGSWTTTNIPELWTFSRFHLPENTFRQDLGFRCASDEAP